MALIVTVSRQLGAGGTQIASRVANRLNLTLVDRQILDHVSEQAGVPSGVVEAVDESPAAAKQRPKGTHPAVGDLTYSQLIQGAIHEFVRRGDVLVVGRGAHLLLKDRPGLLRVKIVAPVPVRVQSLMERLSLNQGAAERAIRDSDKNRAEYVRRAYKADWTDLSLYDLVINTGVIDYDTAAEMIIIAAEAVRERERARAAAAGETED